jgi:predicted site-specific integrase-resolvase
MTDLVGLTQIAERLAVPRNTVDSWRHRGKLPPPDLMIGKRSFWHWGTIAKWKPPRSD